MHLRPTTTRSSRQQLRPQDWALIIFVFVQERKVRMEVGYGLEGSVPDSIASRVIREQIGPQFAAGNYAGGLNAGIDTLIARIEGREQAIPHEGGQGRPGTINTGIPPQVFLLIIIFIFVFVIGPMLRRGGCSGCGCIPFIPFGGSGVTFGSGGGGFSGGGGGGWNIGGGWGGGGGGSFGGGGATGSW